MTFSFGMAQSILKKEQSLKNLEKNYVNQTAIFDSLNNIQKTLLERISILKKSNADNSTIANLMADALILSKEIDLINEQRQMLSIRIKKQRNHLYTIYSGKIDSLKKIDLQEDDPNNSGQVNELLNRFIEKRQYVSPALPLFSFDTNVFNKIDLDNAKELDFTIYNDFLQNAIKEIDSNIVVLRNKQNETEQMLVLVDRTEDFTNEFNDTRIYGTFDIQNNQFFNSNEGSRINSPADFFGEISEIKVIYDQLEPVLHETIERPDLLNKDSLLSEEYLMLLQNTEKTLLQYRSWIESKLNK